ncbi:MAG: TerB family tellurite resistance protein [Rhizobiaceae bacterium]|nr:TerB family tellurite resistance protein [Rhizobiaceae bacterium]
MLDKLRNFLKKTTEPEDDQTGFDATDRQLAQAALMFHVIAADGIVHDEEKTKLQQILEERYELTNSQAQQLIEEARRADSEAIDLYAFTRILKRQLSAEERLELIESLWEMVYADGEIHELEDNVVWRIAELLAINKRDRMEMKRKVRNKLELGRKQH